MSDDIFLSTSQRLNDLRARVVSGEEVSPEEYRDIIASIRATRLSAAMPTKTKAKAKSSSSPINLEDLMS